MKNKETLISLTIGVIAGVLLTLFIIDTGKPSPEKMIAEYYAVENAVSVSPYDVKSAIQRGTYDQMVVVDTRTQAQYEAGHIIGAVSIPAFVEGTDNEARMVEAYSKLIEENPDKDIITYCNSAACMLSNRVGQTLAENGIYVKHLNIGWNEWRYYWTLWNGEDGTSHENFIATGSEPGVPDLDDEDKVIAPCDEDSEFRC